MFTSLVERIWKKFHGWKESTGGKEVLVKAVLQSILTYLMSLYNMPKGILHEMIKTICKFWWKYGSKDRMSWISRHTIHKKKADGELEFKNLELFNEVLLAKSGWRLLEFPNTLVAQVLMTRYFPDITFLQANCDKFTSFLW